LKTIVSTKALSIILMLLSVALAAGSVVLFAIGWDKLKEAQDAGSLTGRLASASVEGLIGRVTMTIRAKDAREKAIVPVNKNGEFLIRELRPGQYLLGKEGKGLVSGESPIEVKREKTSISEFFRIR
jgi:hypothetical protein